MDCAGIGVSSGRAATAPVQTHCSALFRLMCAVITFRFDACCYHCCCSLFARLLKCTHVLEGVRMTLSHDMRGRRDSSP